MSSEEEADVIKTENGIQTNGDMSSETKKSPVDKSEAEPPVVAESASFNPSVSDDEENEENLEKLKGDAIGNTLYSERFVLSTLLKLTKHEKDLSEDESFEKDLCSLWDMTIEEDVVRLLLKYNVLELFAGIIESTDDKRLTEILVGMLANMCNIAETRNELCENRDVIKTILNLISCSDSLSLIQLMRFLYVILPFENSGDEIIWFEHFRNCENFVEYFSYILGNSINANLLVNALEALNVICAKFVVIEVQQESNELGFTDVFIKEDLIKGTIEAFKVLLPKNNIQIEQKVDDTATPSQNTKKIMSLFLDVHVILSQYDDISRSCYQPHISDLLNCISQILAPLCQPMYLLPLTSNEQGIIENINEILQALCDPFDKICFAQMITIWDLINTSRDIKTNQQSSSNSGEDFNDEENANDEVNPEDICLTILELVTRTVRNSTTQQLESGLKLHDPATVIKLLSALKAGEIEDDIKDCCFKIESAFEVLNCTNGESASSN